MKKLTLLLITAIVAVSGTFAQTHEDFARKEVNIDVLKANKFTLNKWLKCDLKSSLSTQEVESYEGDYIVKTSEYFQYGQNNDIGYSIVTINKVDEITYSWEDWNWFLGADNEVIYFQIDPNTNVISYPTEWNGVPQTSNGESIITPELNPDDFGNVAPLAGININKAIFNADKNSVNLHMVYGSIDGGSNISEYYFELELELGVKSGSIKSQSCKVNESFDLSCEGYFQSVGGGELNYSASLSDGGSLPEGLSFNSENGTFSGTPTLEGEYRIKLSASNAWGVGTINFMFVVYGDPILEINNPPVWSEITEFGNPLGESRVLDAVSDKNGYLYTYGMSDTVSSFYGNPITKGVFLAKHDIEGNVEWLKQFSTCDYHNAAKQVVLDSISKHVYITGTINEDFIIPDEDNILADEEGNTFILKYGTDGTFKYAIKEAKFNEDPDLTVDYAGNVILTATFSRTIIIGDNTITSAGRDDVLVAKYNELGENLWAIQSGGEGQEYSGLSVCDKNNNIYLVGEFISEDVVVNQMAITLAENEGNTIIAKLNPQGETQWIKKQAGSFIHDNDFTSWPSSFNIDYEGNLYVRGWCGDSTYFNTTNEPIILQSKFGTYGSYLGKFDNSGNALWVKNIEQFHYAFGYSTMDVDNHGNVCFGIDVHDLISIDNVVINKEDDESDDLLLLKYTSDGELDWGRIIKGTGYSYITSVRFVNNQVIAMGAYDGLLNFGEKELSSEIRHGFIGVLEEETTTSIFSNKLGQSSLKVYPNPAKDQLTINYKGASVLDASALEVFLIDNLGRKSSLIYTSVGSNSIEVDVKDFNQGIYYLQVNAKGEQAQVQKIIITE